MKKKRKLWKSTIVIYSDYDPHTLELSDLAREAESGDAYCAGMESEIVNDFNDVEEAALEFFDLEAPEVD